MRVIQSKLKRPFNLLAIGARGHIAAAGSEFTGPGDVDVWDLASGELAFRTHSERALKGLAFTLDGEHLLVGMYTGLHVFQVSTGEMLSGMNLTQGFPRFTVSATGRRLLAIERVNENFQMTCWELADGPAFRRLWVDEHREPFSFDSPAISWDGNRIAVAMKSLYGSGGQSSESVSVRDATDGTVQTSIRWNADEPVMELKFTTDGSLLLARSWGRIVKVVDATTGLPKGELIPTGRAFVTGIAVHPGGLLATCRNNGTVCFWNLEKQKLVRTLNWKLGKLLSVAFSPDGNIGAAGTEDGQVIVWDMDE